MSKTFTPDQDHSREFRDALGCFATGVTIVTAQTPDGPVGMTANSFSSISLTPPLVLWSPSKHSKRYPAFEHASHFCIHVLRDDQKDLALEFAKRGDAFDLVDWTLTETQTPVIQDCLTSFECRTDAIHDGGDHVIVVGRVQTVRLNAGAPLIFTQSAYGGFSST